MTRFNEMTNDEMMFVEGGKCDTVGEAVNLAAGVVAVCWAPIITVVCPPAGVAVGAAGAVCLVNAFD